ncbi:MAG TPA: hypothetical protein V6D09_13875 [Leptolyngbyaceae cyanobacterium]
MPSLQQRSLIKLNVMFAGDRATAAFLYTATTAIAFSSYKIVAVADF